MYSTEQDMYTHLFSNVFHSQLQGITNSPFSSSVCLVMSDEIELHFVKYCKKCEIIVLCITVLNIL